MDTHLLRTLAAVPPSSRVLVVGDPVDGLIEALNQLGFSVEVSGNTFPTGEEFDWVVSFLDAEKLSVDTFAALRRALAPGAWVWVRVNDSEVAPEALIEVTKSAKLAVAEAPHREESASSLRGIFRRVEATTTA